MPRVNMDTFLDELYVAEFGRDIKKIIELLERASTWTTHYNLVKVCVYLGAETEEEISTVEGCQEIIKEEMGYWKRLL